VTAEARHLFADVGPLGEERDFGGQPSRIDRHAGGQLLDTAFQPGMVVFDHARCARRDRVREGLQPRQPRQEIRPQPGALRVAHRDETVQRGADTALNHRPGCLHIFLLFLDFDKVGKRQQEREIDLARDRQGLPQTVQSVHVRLRKGGVGLHRPWPPAVIIPHDRHINPASQDPALDDGAHAIFQRREVPGHADDHFTKPMIDRADLDAVTTCLGGDFSGPEPGHAAHHGQEVRCVAANLLLARSHALGRDLSRLGGPIVAITPPPAFDALSLAAIVPDLNAHAGRRLAGVRQPDPQTIVLGLRDGRRTQEILCSIHPQAARIHLGAPHIPGERLGPFGLLLRSRLLDARLTRVEQPPFERILYLELDTLDGPHTLVAELMGRHSNLILVRGAAARGAVVGALKLVTEQMSHRTVGPGRPYRLPPADRPHPDAIDAAALAPLLAGEGPLWRALAQQVLGLGPVLAHEAALRAGLDPAMPAGRAAASAASIADAIQALAGAFRAAQFAPTLYLLDGRPTAFAALPLRVYAALEAVAVDAMSEAVRRYYDAGAGGAALEERRRTLAAAVQNSLRQTARALAANRAALAESEAAERFRVFGDLLLTYGHEAPSGATSVRVPDHTAGGAMADIPLDPALGPVDNARRYFRRYAKARAGAAAIPARIATLESAALSLRESLVQIETAASADDLYEVHADLVARRLVRRPPRSRPAARTGPRRFEGPGGAVIVAGRSARENDEVTFHVAGPEDLWFHARALPGAHVILKTSGAPSDAAVTAAAQVAAYYSEGRGAAQVAVDVAPRRRVRKARGAAPGAVIYEGERTLRVPPALPGGFEPARR